MGTYIRNATIAGNMDFESGSKADFKSGSELEADDSSTLDINVELDMDVALTAAGEIAAFTGTINHATAAAEGLDVTLTQLTTPRTAGNVSAIKVATTSLAGDSGGIYNNMECQTTDGGGAVTHNAIKVGAGFDAALTADTADLVISTTTSGELQLSAVALLNIDAGANLDVDVTGTLDVLATGAMSIDATGASNVSATSGNLTVSTLTTGTLILDSVALLDMNAGANLDIDVTGTVDLLASSTISIDGTGNSNLSIDTGDLTVSTTTSGSLLLDGVALVDLNAGANLDIDVTGSFDMLSTGVFSIDGTGASNVTAATGNLTLATTTSGDVIIDSAANVQIAAASGSTIQLQDDVDNAKITAWDSSAITTANTRTVTMTDYDLNLTACPVVVSKQVTNVEIAALGAVANGQIAFGAAIPAGAVPCGGWIVRVTDVSGGAIDSATASLGLNGGDEDRYTTAETVFTGAGAGTQFAAGVAFDGTEAKHAEGAITPAVNIVVTTGTADACTAGDMTAYFSYIVPEGV